MQDFCRSDRCHRHERACPRQPTSKTSTTPTAPGQWKCNHCNQIFKEHSKYQSYITNQELISCRFCMQDFCRTDRRHRHERTCPRQPTSTTSITPTVPGQWKCNRCNQIFKEHSRYQSHITHQQLISCRFCPRNFCSKNRCTLHERSDHSQSTRQPTAETLQPTTSGGAIDLDVPILGNTKYQKQKGYLN